MVLGFLEGSSRFFSLEFKLLFFRICFYFFVLFGFSFLGGEIMVELWYIFVFLEFLEDFVTRLGWGSWNLERFRVILLEKI